MKDGGPAFPIDLRADGFGMNRGMSLRDYFAAAALQGHVACHNILEKSMSEEECKLAWINAAAFSYRCADAMIAEREKQ